MTWQVCGKKAALGREEDEMEVLRFIQLLVVKPPRGIAAATARVGAHTRDVVAKARRAVKHDPFHGKNGEICRRTKVGVEGH